MGGFVAPAGSFVHKYNVSTTGAVLPEITFNVMLDFNDGMLADHIARQEEVAHEEALNEIDRFVNECRQRLEEGKTVVIEQVGVLSKDETNRIRFEPFNREVIQQDTFSITGETSISTAPEILPLEESPLMPVTVESKKELFRTVGGLLLFGLIGTWLYTLVGTHDTANNGPVVFNTAPAYVQSADEEQPKPVSNTIENEAARPVTAAPVAAVNSTERSSPENRTNPVAPVSGQTHRVTGPSGSYYSIAGSFSTAAAANRKVNQLQRMGFSHAEVLPQGAARFLVFIERSPSANEARELSAQFSDRGIVTWIFHR